MSLSVDASEHVALLGANGAGKSSLVLAASGMLPLEEGGVRSLGRDLTGQPPYAIREAGIAAVPEGHSVLASLTVHESLGVATAFLKPDDAASGIEFAYETFPELAERKGQIAGSLSGGQQQMLVLAQALVGLPRVVLVD